MKKTLISVLILCTAIAHGQDVLVGYIRHGIENNLALKQMEFSYQASVSALKEARGMFLPSVSIEARYSRAGGGRMIDIPVGDLVNPIYSSLNDMMELIGQQPAFPTNIPNETIPFLREEEHDTKVRVIQPIFQPAIHYNHKIKTQLSHMQKEARNAYARELVSEIKRAYYTYLKTIQIGRLLEDTRPLLEENIRVNQSLFKNEKVTAAAVSRAEAELYEFQQTEAEAEKNRILAASHFNFLLNHPLDSIIEEVPIATIPTVSNISSNALEDKAVQDREEVKQLTHAVNATASQIGLSKSAFLPGISLVADYGFQGEKYGFTKKDDYWMASMILQWNLFNGFQDAHRVQQSKLEKNRRSTQLEEAKKQIRLHVRQASQEVAVAIKSMAAAEKRKSSAQKAFQIIDRKYKEGMASLIEFIDARATKTSAEVNHIIAQYDYYIRQAELERATATYPISNE